MMVDFVNTIDVLGDDVVIDSIIDRSIVEFKDNTITALGRCSFVNCTALRTVSMPNARVASEWMVAFEGCTSLENVDVKALNMAGVNAFKNCSSLKKLKLPSVSEVWREAFNGCTSLIELDLPSITKIRGQNGYAEPFNNCKALTVLILRGEVMCVLERGGAFNGTPISSGTGYIYVPRALVDSYKVATNWSARANQLRALEDYTVDGTTIGETREHCESIVLDATPLMFDDSNSKLVTVSGLLGVYDTYDWSSSDICVAIVKNGEVTPIGPGTAIISVKCGDIVATRSVTVADGVYASNILTGVGFSAGGLDASGNVITPPDENSHSNRFSVKKYAGSDIVVTATSPASYGPWCWICYYDSNGAFINRISGTGSTNIRFESTVPDNAVYAAFSLHYLGRLSTMDIHCNDELIGHI